MPDKPCNCPCSCTPTNPPAARQAARKLARLTIQPIPASQPRLDPAALPALAARLTERDYQILDHLHRHQVLTTHQIQRMFFGIVQATRARMTTLLALNAVVRFRPWAGYGAGSAPIHWALGKAGAHVLAARREVTVKELGYDPDTKVSASSRLHHQVGVNDFFSRLHAHARHTPTTALKAWLSEKECGKQWGDLARPDAYGCWTESSRQIDFFLEHDTGTEPLKRVAAKVDHYRDLAEATRFSTPVLFWLPNRTRETNLRKLFNEDDIPVATAVHSHNGDSPAGPIWLPAFAEAGQPRMRLADLDQGWPHLTLGTIPDQPDTSQDENAFLDRIFGQEESER
ncbi:replication-relaxation family protein [Nonomuraea sp. NPDC050540]|uniref:replication-relaxation family protein n=1 Tax=Nonomuraea sp. NPDC050540 TaxID=3364367 RepID=UPI0037BDF2E5